MSIETKKKIEHCLQVFSQGSLAQNALNLFTTLGYNTDRQASFDKPSYSTFKAAFVETNSKFKEEKALVKEWKYVDLLFQLSKDELNFDPALFEKTVTTKLPEGKEDKTIIETYLFFVIELSGAAYTRTSFSQITREVNKLFPMPVMILFKTGSNLTLSVINRRLHKKDESKDVLEKVTLIKDISIECPHRAHIEILFDLSFDELLARFKFTNFVELHNAWQKTLDTKELNKRFYQELFNWYLWACRTVEFKKPEGDDTDDAVHTSISVIRMLTRLIFCWFIKEKRLIPEKLFDENELTGTLKKFAPSSMDNSDYYTAVLQNLFFATLNTEMPKDAPGSRKFHEKHERSDGYSEGYLDHLLYRYRENFVDPEMAVSFFTDIPFLNGGLFECLDTRDQKTGKEIRYDGFSSKPSKRPKVPNGLFFGSASDIDLSRDFGEDKKKKHESVRGLINIFNDFKFTIEENTPLEEEIALDPELLGKVFENLLASYNPETKTTARKQTGSFYTPREIVNYMVDESLIAYLKTKLTAAPQSHEELAVGQLSALGNDQIPGQTRIIMSHDNRDEKKEKEVEDKLRRLFNPAIEGNSFAGEENEADRIIEHLSNCRILDPACGSGAFPMGVLHKMVYVLAKLDPNNKKWKQAQLKKAQRDLESAQKMEDPEIKEKAVDSANLRISYIKESFDNPNHELDYARKLFLIENCIYGVDIQNIAVQISKLRFFISLMVDQRVNEKKPNRGILSLPNLETKFVAANSLVGLPTEIYNIGTEAQKTESTLTDLRSKIFFTRKYSEKKKLKKQEVEMRQQLWDEIHSTTLQKDIADKIAGWNPFDPIHSAPFFDAETMFGFKGGFNLVIGNPPYVRQESIKELKPVFKNLYHCFTGVADLFVYFYERGFKLLAENGILTFISSNKYFRSGYGEKLRDYLGSKATLVQLIDFGDAPVFDAIAYPSIAIIQNAMPTNKGKTRVFNWEPGPDVIEFERLFKERSFEMPQKDLKSDGWRLENRVTLALLDKLRKAGKPLGEYVKGRFYRGILTGLNEAFVVDRETRDRLIKEHKSSEEVLKPFLRGRDVKRWRVEYAEQYLIKIESSENKGHPWSGKPEKEAEKIFAKSLPAIHMRFDEMRDALIKRDDQGKYFWELRSCAYWEEFEKPKILYPDIFEHCSFVWDENKFFTGNTTYFIPTNDNKLAGILNSCCFEWFYSLTSNKVRGGYMRAFSDYMQFVPIPRLSDVNERELINIIKNIKLNPTHPLESRLDALVAHHYNLTLSEYTLILIDLKIPDPMKSACLEEYKIIINQGAK